jgi:hypothetical protein
MRERAANCSPEIARGEQARQLGLEGGPHQSALGTGQRKPIQN